jgi:hypothetical protein
MIDSKCVSGGICYNQHGAYALVLRGKDEIKSDSPEKFTYRCRTNDPGAFRLTSKCHERDKCYIRVLRTHALHSLWAPVAGIRYDGMCVYQKRRFRLLLTSDAGTESQDGHGYLFQRKTLPVKSFKSHSKFTSRGQIVPRSKKPSNTHLQTS